MYTLVYISRATVVMENENLYAILAKSREKNRKLDITGMLLYSDKIFLQVLEGKKETVSELYKTIKTDSRHHHVKTLLTADIEDRVFGHWEMGFREISRVELDNIPGLTAFLDMETGQVPEDETRSETYRLIASFRQDPNALYG